MQRAHNLLQQVKFFKKESPVPAFASDPLWAPKIDVHGVAEVLDVFCSAQQRLRLIPTKLNEERAVSLTCSEYLLPVLWVFGEKSGVEHRSVA